MMSFIVATLLFALLFGCIVAVISTIVYYAMTYDFSERNDDGK
jgi:hypothetical protein